MIGDIIEVQEKFIRVVAFGGMISVSRERIKDQTMLREFLADLEKELATHFPGSTIN